MKSKLIVLTDFLIFFFLILILVFLITNNHHWGQQVILGISLLAWMGYLLVKYHKGRSKKSKIKTIQLLNEQEVLVKEWDIRNEQGLLIGKHHQDQMVDIDLTDADHAVLIEKQHAVLNRTNGNWYLEDLDSRNGTGVKAVNASVKRLDTEEAILVHPGDRIYIAKTILQLVK